MEYESETSLYEEDEEEQEQEPSGGNSDPEDQDDDKFSDAESIQLDEGEEEAVLFIRRKGGVISNQKYKYLLEIRKELMKQRDLGNVPNLRREIKNFAWELDRMSSVTCRAILCMREWISLEDDMLKFADNYAQANKPREKVRCKAPVLTVES